jgi:hypothetical protein
MPITLDPETEKRLEDVARSRQTDPNDVVKSLLEGVVLPDEVSGGDILPFDDFKSEMVRHYGSEAAIPETEYLAEINRGFPEDFWQRYNYLRYLLENEELKESQRPELLRLIDRREGANVERLRYVVDLAHRKGVSPLFLWKQLQLGNSACVGD